jgi:hypothetical protein
MKAVPSTESIAQVAADAASAASPMALKIQYLGAATAGLSWMLDTRVLAAVGAAVAVAGFVTQLVLGLRRDRREQREHDARMTSQFGPGGPGSQAHQ